MIRMAIAVSGYRWSQMSAPSGVWYASETAIYHSRFGSQGLIRTRCSVRTRAFDDDAAATAADEIATTRNPEFILYDQRY